MTGLVTWAVERSRMIIAMIALSIAAGATAYIALPKEGSPDLSFPALYVSVPLPGISATDSERLLVKPLEKELRGIEGLEEMTGIASENHAGVFLKFKFGWDKAATLAEVRDKVDRAQTEMPAETEEPNVVEFNFSEFPIIIISLSGDVPERTLLTLAKDLQREVESLSPVLEAGIAGHRDEMIEVLIDPLKMEAYNVTAQELLQVVSANNALVAAGEVESAAGAFAVKLPGSFETIDDIYRLPVRVDGDRVVALGDIATIRRTFEDAKGTARFNSEPTVALQVKKRSGENIIETVGLVRGVVASVVASWPEPLQAAVEVEFSMDESQRVLGMVDQLEGSVLTAVLLVMFVVVVALGTRSSLLVGIAIPCSFLLSFALLAVFGMSINNMVMFGLILAVGMLVDGAIVVTEYADRRLSEGAEPSRAYGDAARRMFWPIVSSTATTLCAFLPMLFWPGMPGEFMGQLPVTLIFVLSASLIVALIFLPVLGTVVMWLNRTLFGWWLGAGAVKFAQWYVERRNKVFRKQEKPIATGYQRTPFGRFVKLIVGNPVMPFVAILVAIGGMVATVMVFSANNNGVEFFVKTEPERSIAYVRARGNLSLHEQDRLVKQVEQKVLGIDGVASVFAFAGDGRLQGQIGSSGPNDAIGQVQIELAPWGERRAGDDIIADIEKAISTVPGVIAELTVQKNGPQQGKPVQFRVLTNDWKTLMDATAAVRTQFESMEGLTNIDDTRPLPGIDWSIEVDRAMAGRFGADIATVGTLVQLVTRGALLDTIRPDDSDDELEIRVRFPKEDRVLATLEQLKIRTGMGLVPLSNFIEISPEESLGELKRFDTIRFIDIRADVKPGVNVNQQIAALQEWVDGGALPGGVDYMFVGDQKEQEESQAFLASAFLGALGLMFAILLAQFNSVYNSVLVLTAVVMSVTGVMIGMLVMDQTFSIIMTGTGIVALAGIVVNNNIVLIDTYQEFARDMPRLEAIIRTAEQRIRPVLLTTITTMAGLAPMMFAASVNFGAFGELWATGIFTAAGWSLFFSDLLLVGAPTALWWAQLATAVVFGLGVSTFLTLLMTPAALALRVWLMDYILRRYGFFHRLAAQIGYRALFGRAAYARFREDVALHRRMVRADAPEFTWSEEAYAEALAAPDGPTPPLAALPPRRFPEAAE